MHPMVEIIRKIYSLYSIFFMVTVVVEWSSKLLFFDDFVIHETVVFNPKSLIRVVSSMNKLLILYTTISQITSNSTNYYQLTKYYVDKTKLLFSHRTSTIWYITFH